MNRATTGYRSVDINVTSASWANQANDAPNGIFCNSASTITGALAHDTAESNWVLPAGYSPISFRSINISSTTKSGYKIIYGS